MYSTMENNYTEENDTDVIQVPIFLYFMIESSVISLNAIIGALGNALVFLTVYSIPSLHTVSNVLLASLSCSDFLSAVIGAPLAIYVNINSGVTFRDTSLKGDVFYIPLYISCPVSVWHLFFISLDRYFAISYPYKYQMHATIQRVFYFIILSWVLGIVWGIVPLFGGLEIDEDCLPDVCKTYSKSAHQVYEIMSAVGIFLTFITIIIIYARIFYISKKLSNDIRPRPCNLPVSKENKDRASLINTIKVTAMVVGGFFLCWSPMFVYMIAQNKPDNVSLNILRLCAEIASLCSLSVNPFIYNFKLKTFRNGFRQTIRKIARICKRQQFD
ncbi:octopamine receptor beta-2R-like [Anneissia japonica]|uniref:octopamine receptor beta-2R-like n=1 Tax=Anneissia japonica TaxID=1529436 RepID=UPI0014257A75|nr:octopamine receptor beta-2R-like [Anneissia japonica]